MPLKDTVKLGAIARRIHPEGTGEDRVEVRWERHVEDMPEVSAKVERVSGLLPWTHSVEFEHNGEQERWLLRHFFPVTQLPE
ncbi:hypothetical protein [Nitratireductor sp. GCM10026969]|uniref:hypothetical protein n=1 Tax=Nitratireductor sp. GCM10026969 TaxID=3252645 RepID=UPI00360A2944